MARGRSSTSPPTGVPAGSSDAIRRLTAILHRRVASCLSCQFPCGFPGRPARAKSLQGAQRHRRDRLQRQRGASGDQPLDKIKCKIRPKVPHDPCVLHRGHRQAAVGRKGNGKAPSVAGGAQKIPVRGIQRTRNFFGSPAQGGLPNERGAKYGTRAIETVHDDTPEMPPAFRVQATIESCVARSSPRAGRPLQTTRLNVSCLCGISQLRSK